MSRIVISTVGTMGDFVPFVGLGRALADRGHHVVVAVNDASRGLFEAAGLATVRCGPRYGPAQARAHPQLFDSFSTRASQQELLHELFDLEANYRDLRAACADADLLVAVSLQLAAPRVHDALGIPWVAVSLLPGELELRARAMRAHLPAAEGLRPLEGSFLFLEYLRAPLILLASSRHFHDPARIDLETIRTTGFWFYDGADQADWSPPETVRRFLEPGKPAPAVLSLGSLPVQDAARHVRLHREAAGRLGLRLLVQRGWARLGGDDVGDDSICFAGALPHDWLFARSAVIIHHGGVGVTARALKHGRPMVVEPHGRDQFYNALRAVELGVGVAMHPHELTVHGLAQALDRARSDAFVERASRLAARIETESGLDTACRILLNPAMDNTNRIDGELDAERLAQLAGQVPPGAVSAAAGYGGGGYGSFGYGGGGYGGGGYGGGGGVPKPGGGYGGGGYHMPEREKPADTSQEKPKK